MEMIDKNGNRITMSLDEYKEYIGNVRVIEKIPQLKDNQYISVRQGKEVKVEFNIWSNVDTIYLIEHITQPTEKIAKHLNRTVQSVYMKINAIKVFLQKKYVKHNGYENRKQGLNTEGQPKEFKAQYSNKKVERKVLFAKKEIDRRKDIMTKVNYLAREIMRQDNTLTLQNALSLAFKRMRDEKEILNTLNQNQLLQRSNNE